MRASSYLVAAAVAAGLALPVAAAAQEATREPYELVRELRALQDRIARGDSGAHAAQRDLLGRIAQAMASADAAKWQEPRNARAAVTYVLSGGNPSVLRNLLGHGVRLGLDEKLIKGAIAYGEGRFAEATDLLVAVDARALDQSLAGHVALVQSELVTRKDPKKALAYLDDARLLAPGTLVEEAALRHQVAILGAAGEVAGFESLAAQYLRRFQKSFYLENFLVQFARDMAASAKFDEPARLTALEAALAVLDGEGRGQFYLAIAREGILKGRVRLASFTAGQAVKLAEEGSADNLRARLYEGAVLIVTEEFDRGNALLQGIDRAELDEGDLGLLEAALSLAAQVRRDAGEAPAAMPPATAPGKAAQRAQQLFAEVDGLLREDKK